MIPQLLPVDLVRLVDLFLCAVTNEDRLSSPFDDDLYYQLTYAICTVVGSGWTHVLRLWNSSKIDLDLGHG